MRIKVLPRLFAVLLLSCLIGAGAIVPSMAGAQDATPAAAGLPEGPLGEQIQWLVDYINMPADEAATVDLTTIFTPGVLADVPADQLAAIIGRLRDQLAPVTLDTASIATSRDTPPTSANFTLIGRDGTQQPVSLTVVPDSGLIGSIWFSSQLPPVATAQATATVAPTETETATTAPTETATEIPTETATTAPTETATEISTETATSVPTETATELPTETETTAPTDTPTEPPTETPTEVPTETATAVPTDTPTEAPTETPTTAPTHTPTLAPTDTPTEAPTETATSVPTDTPTEVPTETATSIPTDTPTEVPTETATSVPTRTPTPAPTDTPTELPTETATLAPTHTPTRVPTDTPTTAPTETATTAPTETSTTAPTETATTASTETETSVPTETATTAPTETPTAAPTETETEEPTETATEAPTELPTQPVIVAASPEVATEAASPIASPETESASPVAVEEGSPQASPEAAPFGDSAVAQQAAWTWSILNNGGESISESEIEEHADPGMLTQVPAAQVAAGIAQIQQLYGPFTLEPDSILVTENEPPTNLSYVIVGKDGTKLQVSVTIDPESGLITGFTIQPAAMTGTPVAVALPAGLTDADVSFTSGDDTIYGSFLVPDVTSGSQEGLAALIISGSGPTDRNGNSPGLSMNTNLNLAIALAQDGIPSLRYDKLGSGQTGLGSHADASGIDYELFAQEARDAAAFLAEQPGVDPSKLILVGHSEGALFALVLAQELTDAGTPPAALILASPLSVRYLDILHEQLTGKFKAAVAAQTMTDDQAAKLTTELEGIIEGLRTTGNLPSTAISPELATIFSPANAAFLAQIDKIDPGEVAAGLPNDLPVLVLLGNKDAQVTGDQVRHLMDGLRQAGNDQAHFAAIPLADHTLRVIEGTADPSVDYANPDLEFSPLVVTEIRNFLAENGLAPAE